MTGRSAGLVLLVAVGAASGCDRSLKEIRPVAGSTGPPQAPVAPATRPTPAPPVAEVGPPSETLATRRPASDIRASLPPLPMAPFALPRPADDVRLAYEFAALHPEVLKYVPCYCGCERTGHQHNESCFVSSRDDQGRVLGWDTHGMG